MRAQHMALRNTWQTTRFIEPVANEVLKKNYTSSLLERVELYHDQ